MFSEKKGFTLIELLLVMSIISFLSTVIMAAVNEARGGARLAVIGQEIDSLNVESNIYYTGRGSFSETIKTKDDCPTSPEQEWGFLGSTGGLNLINSIKKTTGDVGANCAISPSSWAIEFQADPSIVSDFNLINTVYAQTVSGYVCVDSSGNVVMDIEGDLASDGGFRSEEIKTNEAGDFFYCG